MSKTVNSHAVDRASSVVEQHSKKHECGKVDKELVEALGDARNLYVHAALSNEYKESLQTALARIYNILWPEDDPGRSWDSDTIARVANVFENILHMKIP